MDKREFKSKIREIVAKQSNILPRTYFEVLQDFASWLAEDSIRDKDIYKDFLYSMVGKDGCNSIKLFLEDNDIIELKNYIAETQIPYVMTNLKSLANLVYRVGYSEPEIIACILLCMIEDEGNNSLGGSSVVDFFVN